jgi:hypothetical protein
MLEGDSAGPSLVWLDRPLPPRGEAADARLPQVRSLSNKGDYEQAARIAEAILADGAGDFQAFSRYLFGVFLAKGFVVLPRVLGAFGRACEAVFADGDRKAALEAETSLGWLCRTLRDLIDFHLAQRDVVWRRWVDASDPALCDAIVEACAQLARVVGAAVPGSQSLESMASLGAFARGTLRGLVPRPPPPAPPAPEPVAVVEPEPEASAIAEEEPGEPRAPVRLERGNRRAGSDEDDAPAMRLLRQKLAAFQELVDRGDLGRAAIIARDLERVIEHFDPRVYLPRLFAPYFRRLASSGEALTPFWEGEGSVGWRALEQLYQVDLEAFLEEDDGP